MPWREVSVMDERVQFLADYLRDAASVSVLCERYGISRKTGHKWIKRYLAEGPEGLRDRSRRPRHSPERLPYVMRQAIIELRERGSVPLGPKKILPLLAQRFPDQALPSKTTIYNILKAEGHVPRPRRRRRVSPYQSPFSPVRAANDVWSVDFKGQFKLGNGQWCYPLTVMDHHSRYVLGCEGMGGTRYPDTRRVFERLFQDHGLPWRIRSDNGAPFASTATAGLSRLSIWWIKLGILPERIAPGRPQQNGRHERMHRTLKRAVTHPVSRSMARQQAQFDAFRHEYNEHRPHESLGQVPPCSRYQDSPRSYPSKVPVWDYPSYWDVRPVSCNGVVYWRSKSIYVGYLLRGEPVGLEEIDNGVWAVSFGPVVLGQFDERGKPRHREGYLTLKV